MELKECLRVTYAYYTGHNAMTLLEDIHHRSFNQGFLEAIEMIAKLGNVEETDYKLLS